MTKNSKIIIEFPEIFVSVNSQYITFRGKRSYPRVILTLEAKAYKNAVGWVDKSDYKGKILTGPIKLSIWYWFPTKRVRDIQNDKLTLDALENVVIKNDSQVTELHLYKRYKKNKPYTKIEIEEMTIKDK